MRPNLWLILGMLLLAGCVNDSPQTQGAAPTKSTAQLLNTYWKLTQLGEQVITTPQDAREIHFVMESENPRVHGFSGCNRMMGGYVFGDVARWEIAGETLTLLNADGKILSVFESRYLK